MFNKVLIANRGEIALRVIKTAIDLGIKTVAVYSTVDRNALHVLAADEAVLIGEPPSSQSYLSIEKIISAAKATGAEAIHPGYGFLSENAEFAHTVAEAGLTFIGPSPESIRVMGSKLEAKAAVGPYQIPLVPGTESAISDIASAKTYAEEIGYPILIKASAGGGGKGMRIVFHRDDFESQMDRAKSEAKKAFGDASVFIEKYLNQPRHIEIQILADQHGNVVHLFERECSIQRRHQKIIEEAPSAIMDETLRARMGSDAVKVAKACNYVGAGTVEFLMDSDRNYYFLEMNTRLQVEHPVTEMITGLDLVALQFEIAAGKRLPFRQEDLTISGHAVELRVYAEDPFNHFLPSTGTLSIYRQPQGPGVRVDDGYVQGMEIPVHYDPMLSKLIVHGNDRQHALHRMREAISGFLVEGVKTTLPFGAFVIDHPDFISGKFDTHFAEKWFAAQDQIPEHSTLEYIAAVLSARVTHEHLRVLKVPLAQKKRNNFS